MNFKFILVLFVFLFASACSVVPYENDFACRLKDNYGKCISMDDAYKEAKTGIEEHPLMKPASEQDDEDEEVIKKNESNIVDISKKQDMNYDNYINGYYKELNKLVDKPITPMVKQAKTIRTLIIPYSNDSGSTMWGERYAHSIIKEPSFIYGQYMLKKSERIESIMHPNE